MLSQVLVGTLVDGTNPHTLRNAMIHAGRLPDEVVILAGRAGLEELLGHDRDHGILGRLAHLVRHIEALDSDGTGHVLCTAEEDLRAGHSVVLVRHVDRAAAAPLSDLLRGHGVAHVHYIGRWTVAEHGTVPSVAA